MNNNASQYLTHQKKIFEGPDRVTSHDASSTLQETFMSHRPVSGGGQTVNAGMFFGQTQGIGQSIISLNRYNKRTKPVRSEHLT